ncbi:MAG: hypothetical protein V3574_03525 [Candidatus Moraniibacteriota bacterium]
MQLNPADKHIQKIQKERSELFVKSLKYVAQYQDNSRNYYLVTALVSLAIILSDVTLFYTFESNHFIKISLFFTAISFLFSLASYLNHLEKNSEKLGDIFTDLDLKRKKESDALRGFYAGRIDEGSIRDFYLNHGVEVDKKYFISHKEILPRWINMIFLSLATIFMLINFF